MNPDNTALLSLTELPAIFAAVVIVIAVVSFCLGRRMRLPGLNIGDDDDGRSENEQQRRNDEVVVVVEESPKMALWSQEKLKKEVLVNWSCSVCLGECGTNADENDRDKLRLLPDCGHVFHRACVDSWLRLRPTCPLCRIPPRGVVFKSPVVGDSAGV